MLSAGSYCDQSASVAPKTNCAKIHFGETLWMLVLLPAVLKFVKEKKLEMGSSGLKEINFI